MKKTDIAYIAGIVDGEGCIQLNYRHPTYDVQVSVTNTKQWLLEWIRFGFGGRVLVNRRLNQGGNRKVVYRWYARSVEALPFLESIFPYLRLKKPQAEIAIKFIKMRGKKGRRLGDSEKIIAEAQSILMASLNKRGAK